MLQRKYVTEAILRSFISRHNSFSMPMLNSGNSTDLIEAINQMKREVERPEISKDEKEGISNMIVTYTALLKALIQTKT